MSARLAVWVLLLSVLASAGSATAATAPSSPILSAKADLRYEIRVENLIENTTWEAEKGCDGDQFSVRENQTYRFREPTQDFGCGEVGYPFPLPPGVERLYVAFRASREFEETGSVSTPKNALQELWIRNAKDHVLAKFQVADPASGDRPDMTQFYVEVHNRTEPSLKVSWFFWDRALDDRLPGTASTQQFTSFIGELRLLTFGTPWPVDTLGVTQHRENETLFSEKLVQVRPPSAGPRNPLTGKITLVVASGSNLTSVRGPQGRSIDLDRLQVRAVDGGTEVVLVDELVAVQGIGAYVFGFTTAEPIPAAPATVVGPPPGPTTIYPLILGLLALPAFPAAFATRYGWGIRRTAHARHRPFVRQVVGIDLGFLAVYIGLCAFVIAGDRIGSMARLPLNAEGWLLNTEFILLTAIFVFLWVAPTRHLVALMRKDLALSEEVQRNLKRSNEELEQFAYVASHDLQEPLRTISGFSHILKTRYGHVLDDAARHYLELNVQSSARMQRLINDLLAYSRVETRPLRLEPVNLNDVASEALRDVERLRQRVRGRILVQPLPTIQVDRGQIRQVLLNLIQNALKYHHPGRAPEIFVGAEQTPSETLLFVRDNGKGIDPQHRERIFRMFQRLEARSSDVDGTGLGLAIVKRIAERHRGRVWVESRPGMGSIFRVAIPKEPPAS